MNIVKAFILHAPAEQRIVTHTTPYHHPCDMGLVRMVLLNKAPNILGGLLSGSTACWGEFIYTRHECLENNAVCFSVKSCFVPSEHLQASPQKNKNPRTL